MPNWATTLVALATAVGGIVTAVAGSESARDTQKATYEALRRADEDKTRQLAELAQSQLQLRAWVTELSARLDERATNAEKVLRKVARPKTALPPPAPPPPAPPPAKAVVTDAVPLPPFEALAK